MNIFLTLCNDIFRHERKARALRKRLGVFNYKIGKLGYHKKPGLVNLQYKERLKKKGHQAWIYRKEQKSDKYFGEFGKRGFIFDKTKVPFYDVPNLEGFELKPYASAQTPQIEEEIKLKLKKLNDFTILENYDRSNDFQKVDIQDNQQKQK